MEPVSSTAYGRSGCYGKIPRLGDFLSRALPHSLIAGLDAWLQDGVTASRDRLGEQWTEHYLVSPVWSFAASPGCINPSAWLGVMIPSVDRVGRYFPFLIMTEVGDMTPCQALYLWQEWFADAESLALDSLEDDFDPAELEQRLAELRIGDRSWSRQSERPMSTSCSGRRYRLGAAATTRDVLAGLGEDAIGELLPAWSLWWTLGSERIDSCLLLTPGMPRSESFSALYDGQFDDAGWSDGGILGWEDSAQAESASAVPEA